jgi:hypothetical protein
LFFEVAKLVGTSVSFIEQHYEHLEMDRLVQSATKTFQIDKDGMIIREKQSGRE